MSKGKRNRNTRREAIKLKQSNPTAKVSPKTMARKMRRQGRFF